MEMPAKLHFSKIHNLHQQQERKSSSTFVSELLPSFPQRAEVEKEIVHRSQKEF
jgi:hypothetical protein